MKKFIILLDGFCMGYWVADKVRVYGPFRAGKELNDKAKEIEDKNNGSTLLIIDGEFFNVK